MLPSEAYGYLHEDLSLHDKKLYTPPFSPRKYTLEVQKELKNTYSSHEKEISSTTHDKRENIDYERYAENFYFNQDLEKYIRIVRAQVKNDLQVDTHFKVKTYDHGRILKMENNLDQVLKQKNKEVDQPKENLVCPLRKVTITNSEHEWHSPPKIIYKPFLEVKF